MNTTLISLNSPLAPDLNRLERLLSKIERSGWYTNFGPLQAELKEKLEEKFQVKNLLLTNNGTTALQVAGRALGCSNYLTTPFSFVATSSAFLWQGDVISFADIDAATLNLCPRHAEKALVSDQSIDGIVATHVYGNACDVGAFRRLGETTGCNVIYDSCHAFGVTSKNDSILGHGDASTLSFHATKIFHTLEGGAVVFKCPSAYERAEELINFGIRPGVGIVDTGTNAKLNEYQAAVGLVNLAIVDEVIEYRRELFERYRRQLSDYVNLPVWNSSFTSNGAYMPIILSRESEMQGLASELMKNNIQSRNYFSPSLNNVFSDCKDYGCKNSELVTTKILCLPLHYNMDMRSVDRVCEVVRNYVGRQRQT